ncbi:MAG: phosphoenolpyruvate carboxykinase [Erysipelotrichaceae bacterium]|jgi:energy-coupling factor transporter ATP-binding protein EcfA2|nr:phosphoenolpyruvate carboxykinase [Erysipelotrichaceae bacterium]
MKKFHLTDTYALINFDASLCDSEVSVLQSKSFAHVLSQFVDKLRRDKDVTMESLKTVKLEHFLDAYKLLYVFPFNDIYKNNPSLHYLLKKRDEFYHFTEMLYDYWRSLQRFGLIASSHLYMQSAKAPDVITTIDHFNSLILSLYRGVSTNLLSQQFHVYRQLPAGVNANLLYVHHRVPYHAGYENLQNIAFISKIATRPPFIAYTKSNTRSGLFQEIGENPLSKLVINKLHFFAFPIKIGPLLAYVYIHRDFLHEGIGLSNLFEFASFDEIKDRKPDIVYLYGISETEYDCTYHHDQENNIYLGFVSRLDKNDYFGYLKKMLLTLHNLAMIDQKKLPIHGAMVSIVLNNDETKNIIVVGDSGAGKSETLEALRIIGKDYIKQMKIVFDDMGTFFKKDGHIYAHGTEIGAFVRLDDLEAGYAYQKIDRAIFLNPDQVNARVVLPVTTYKFIMADHRIDMLLYANNYSEVDIGLRLFNNLEEATDIFRNGQRKAKGTTSEVGLVSSYFANPFGPVQRKEQTEVLLNSYFSSLYKEKVAIGELFTRLAVPGYEMAGPQEAATKLLKSLIGK